MTSMFFTRDNILLGGAMGLLWLSLLVAGDPILHHSANLWLGSGVRVALWQGGFTLGLVTFGYMWRNGGPQPRREKVGIVASSLLCTACIAVSQSTSEASSTFAAYTLATLGIGVCYAFMFYAWQRRVAPLKPTVVVAQFAIALALVATFYALLLLLNSEALMLVCVFPLLAAAAILTVKSSIPAEQAQATPSSPATVNIPWFALLLVLYAVALGIVTQPSIEAQNEPRVFSAALTSASLFVWLYRSQSSDRLGTFLPAISTTACMSILFEMFFPAIYSLTSTVALMAFWLLFLQIALYMPQRNLVVERASSVCLWTALYTGSLTAVQIAVYFFGGPHWSNLLTIAAVCLVIPIAMLVNNAQIAQVKIDLIASQLPASTFSETSERLVELHHLTTREAQVLPYLAQGHSAQSIADHLGLSPNTIKAHRRSLYAKLGIHSRQELIDLFTQDEQTSLPTS